MTTLLPPAQPPADKAQLRSYFRQLRHHLPLADLSEKIVHHLRSYPPLLQAEVVLAYLALPDEINLSSLFWQMPDKIWGIPRCLPGRELAWHGWHPEQMEQNRYGIWQPLPTTPQVDPSMADLVLVPTLAADPWGQRLGYGGGYYDRFLSRHPLLTCGILPQACFSLQPLPRDPWDHPLDQMITEGGIGIPLPQGQSSIN
ncbi:MAG: 5-formyltetrahydrofolate cyclo-ligase [Cyanobacteriota bacterium]|nr:5-formyltetrahydrofolate cyclo-ligase [Cyanobacteriota bacterium]